VKATARGGREIGQPLTANNSLHLPNANTNGADDVDDVRYYVHYSTC